MRVLLLDDIKITKLELPLEISGSFLLKYKSIDSNVERELSIEAIDGKWVLNSSSSIGIVNNKNSYLDKVILENYSTYSLHIIEKNVYLKLYVLPTIEPDSTRAFVSSNKITIGSTSASSIIYSRPGIKELEAEIYLYGSEWFISQPNQSFFGEIYVNDIRITKPVKLKAGDIILVSGLKLIWMKTFIQACMPKSMVMFNTHQFQAYKNDDYNSSDFKAVSDEDAAVELYDYDDYFFHTPNLNPKYEEAEITIDAPPSSVKQEEVSSLVTAGTSITMLASSFASGFNLINSINTNASMTRIVPAAITFVSMIIGSLLLPRIGKRITLNQQRKKELYRITKYSAYLDSKEAEIEREMNKEIQILNDNYSNLPTILDLFYKDTKSAWSREIIDDDFLEVRIGTGSKETQLVISAPEEHFTLEDDALYELIAPTEKYVAIGVAFNRGKTIGLTFTTLSKVSSKEFIFPNELICIIPYLKHNFIWENNCFDKIRYLINQILDNGSITNDEVNYIISSLKKKPNIVRNINLTPQQMMELIEKDESLSFEILAIICKTSLNE